MADTGNSATIAFATTAFTASWTEFDLGNETLDALESSHLATTNYKTFVPSDLKDGGTITGTFFWDQSFSTFPSTGTAETVTVTFPLKSGESTAATFAATGFISDIKRPTVVNGDLMMGELTVQLDGVTTEPTFTAGSA